MNLGYPGTSLSEPYLQNTGKIIIDVKLHFHEREGALILLAKLLLGGTLEVNGPERGGILSHF